MNQLWEIQLLGGLRVRREGRADLRFPTQRVASLLARLAYRPGQAISREELADMLWPDSLLDKGLPRLSGELTRLRHLLEPIGEIARGAVILSDNQSICLNSAAVTTDLASFDAAYKAGLASSDTGAKRESLTRAVETYAGPLLPRFEQDWVEPARQTAAERFLHATELLTAQLAQTGEQDRAIAYARRALETDRRNEEAYCLLLRVLLRAGRHTEMQPLYRELEGMLEENFASTPSAPAARLMAEAERQIADKSVARPVVAPREAFPPPEPPQQHPRLPSGTVTFLATDIEGSTALLHRLGGAGYEAARERHHVLLRQVFRIHGGYEFKEVGDGFWVAFENTGAALECAIACQRALADEPWPESVGKIWVRMAIHVAAVEEKEGDYRGLGLHETARLIGAAHGGQILLSEAAVLLLGRERRADVSFKDLGQFKLRDAPGPEHLFQTVYPGMARIEFAEPSVPSVCTPNIPSPMTRFVGREAEQKRLAAWAVEPQTRLVTVTGMGGTGKTRLVIEVAAALVRHFSGAVWFVPLADLSDARRIPEALLAALRVPASADEDAMETAIRTLSAQPSLLVLDNFEQLVEDGALMIHDLLERVPTLTCLITSRQLLGVSHEREFDVLPLPMPKAGIREAEELGGNVSVQLFVDRAQRRRPDFALTKSNAAAIAELCARLEGVPLSIELAAAWVKMLAPAQLLTQLKTVLMSKERDLPERHRSLKAVLDGSYRLLPPDLQVVFARLSVFRGSWTVEAAADVCEDPFALLSLSQLRDASLILTEEHETDGTRYRMLETLREYAEERLAEQQDAEATRRRHHDFFVRLAQTADTELKGEHQAAWCRKLDAELPNIQTALAYSDDHGRLQVASDLQRYWIIHNRLSEGREWLERGLSGNREAIPDALLSRAIVCAGVLAWSAGDFEAARGYLDEGLEICRKTGSKRGIALALNNRANLSSQQGRFAEARVDYEESLMLWKDLNEAAPLAITLSNLGSVTFDQSDYPAARRYLEDSLRAQEKLNDDFLRANTLENLGNLDRIQNDYPNAVRHLTRCFQLRIRFGDKKATAVALIIIARVFLQKGDFHRSAKLLSAARALLAEAQAALLPSEESELVSDITSLKKTLSESDYEMLWSDGHSMTVGMLKVFIDEIASTL